VLGRDRLPEIQERLREVPGVTVIIYGQRCAAQTRRLRKRGELAEPPRRVFINEAVCEGCGDCGVKSNCLSVLPLPTEFGDKRQVHDPSCNRDYTCLEGDCPSFVTLTPSRSRRARRGARLPAPDVASLEAVIAARVGTARVGTGRTGAGRAVGLSVRGRRRY
jgi:indolepyruvate ferredoxin oxidoreductase